MKTLTIILIYYLDIGCSSYFFKVLSGDYNTFENGHWKIHNFSHGKKMGVAYILLGCY